jgi:hypothetical protein
MSIYLEQYYGDGDADQANYCRNLEMKIHYLMQQMAAAGILKDVNGNKITADLPDDVTSDAEAVRASIDPENF